MTKRKFKGQKQIVFEVSPEILTNPRIEYGDNRNCFIATAIKEQFRGFSNLRVYVSNVQLYTKTHGYKYDILGSSGRSRIIRTHAEMDGSGAPLCVALKLNRVKEL